MEKVKELYKIHLETGEVTTDIALRHNLKPASLYYAFKRLGPVTRGFEKPKLNWSKLFPVITAEAAYIYGLWWADGCNTGDKLTIKLHKDDVELLNSIQYYLECNKVYKDGNAFKLIVHPGRLIHIDINWFPRRKSYTVNILPALNPELYRHFIRGYFDGDGSIGIRKHRPNQVQLYICNVDKQMLESIQKILLSEGINTRLYCEPRGHLGFQDMHTIRVGTHLDRINFFNYIYTDAKFKMQRKFLKYESYVNTVLNSGITIRPKSQCNA